MACKQGVVKYLTTPCLYVSDTSSFFRNFLIPVLSFLNAAIRLYIIGPSSRLLSELK